MAYFSINFTPHIIPMLLSNSNLLCLTLNPPKILSQNSYKLKIRLGTPPPTLNFSNQLLTPIIRYHHQISHDQTYTSTFPCFTMNQNFSTIHHTFVYEPRTFCENFAQQNRVFVVFFVFDVFNQFVQCVQKFVAGSEIWSFLAIFKIIFGQKIEIFKIRPSVSYFFVSKSWKGMCENIKKNKIVTGQNGGLENKLHVNIKISHSDYSENVVITQGAHL